MGHDEPVAGAKPDEQEYRRRLTPLQYEVTRCSVTEPPFRNTYWDHKGDGEYRCVCCDAVLFRSDDKFDSGTGWPSFARAADGARIKEVVDSSRGMERIEVRCERCDAHLGHLFDDGPGPEGMRYCINSASLQFRPGPGT